MTRLAKPRGPLATTELLLLPVLDAAACAALRASTASEGSKKPLHRTEWMQQVTRLACQKFIQDTGTGDTGESTSRFKT